MAGGNEKKESGDVKNTRDQHLEGLSLGLGIKKDDGLNGKRFGGGG